MRTNAAQVLGAQYIDEAIEGIPFVEFVKLTAESDPGFFRWLFDEELYADFDTPLTDAHKAEWEAFLSSIA